MNNCFSVLFRGEYEEVKKTEQKLEKRWLSVAITPRNPIITARAIILMRNSYIHLRKCFLKFADFV